MKARHHLLAAAVLMLAGPAWAAQGTGGPAGANDAFVATPVPTGALPVPPLPEGPPAFAPAPVPNQDVERPRDQQAQRPRTEVEPNLFVQKDSRRGDGYVQGSVGRYEPGRERVTPGVNLRVPLQ